MYRVRRSTVLHKRLHLCVQSADCPHIDRTALLTWRVGLLRIPASFIASCFLMRLYVHFTSREKSEGTMYACGAWKILTATDSS
jgi:hypothetical protein